MRNIYILYRTMFDASGKQLHFGGIENYIENLADIFKQQGWNTILVQPSKKPFSTKTDNIKIEGISVGMYRGNMKKYALAHWAKENADKENDIIIFATDSYAVNINGYNTLAIQHGVSWDKPRLSKSIIRQCIVSLCSQLKYLSYIKSNMTLVCVDHNFVNWLRTWHDTGEQVIHVLYNFYTNKISQQQMYEKWQSDSPLKIIIARRFVDYRGIKLAAKVIQRLLDSEYNIEVTFAGDGPLKAFLTQQFQHEKRVTITQYQAVDSYDVHLLHHIALIPTLGSEGTSLSMIEAMAAGCCVVATNVGGLSNIIIDEFNGILSMPDEDALFLKIKQLIVEKEKAENLAIKGIESITHSCNRTTWANNWVKIIKQLT